MPHVTSATMQTLNQGLKTAFAKGVEAVVPLQKELAMEIQSNTRTENYSWIKQLPVVKEFLTTRTFQNSEMISMAITNKDWEETIDVKYTDIADDNISQYSTLLSAYGETVASHPRQLIFQAIRGGLVTQGVDAVPFFSDAHPTYAADGTTATFDNLTAGAGEGWVLLDNSRSFMRPIIFQNREAPRLDQVGGVFDDRGNMMSMSVPYSVWARHNVGLFLPHLAHAAFVPLTAQAIYDAMQKMSEVRKSDGTYANVNATHLIVSPSMRKTADELIMALYGANGSSNTLAGALKVIVAPEMTGWTQ